MRKTLKKLVRDRSEPDDAAARIRKGSVPKHVAIIMDGNRRWAAKRGLPRLAGHRAGAGAIRLSVEAAKDIGVEYLTLYTFSMENWSRPKDEVSGLMGLFEEMLRREIDDLDKKDVRVRVIGRLQDLPASTRDTFLKGVERTAKNGGLILLIALNYGGRSEITDAVRKLAALTLKGELAPGAITEADISEQLYTAGIPDPDLLIRTSGEQRISNFLLWQIAYAEFWVTERLWPDFNRTDFFSAVEDYQSRVRRFGGTDAAPPSDNSDKRG